MGLFSNFWAFTYHKKNRTQEPKRTRLFRRAPHPEHLPRTPFRQRVFFELFPELRRRPVDPPCYLILAFAKTLRRPCIPRTCISSKQHTCPRSIKPLSVLCFPVFA